MIKSEQAASSLLYMVKLTKVGNAYIERRIVVGGMFILVWLSAERKASLSDTPPLVPKCSR